MSDPSHWTFGPQLTQLQFHELDQPEKNDMTEDAKFAGEATDINILSEEQLEQIRRRAYELYEARGREDGHAVEDWLQAEGEIIAGKPLVADL